VFKIALHLSVSWAGSIQSVSPHPSALRSILILSSHLRLGLPRGLSSSGLPTKFLYAFLLSLMRATCPAHLIFLDLLIIIVEEHKLWTKVHYSKRKVKSNLNSIKYVQRWIHDSKYYIGLRTILGAWVLLLLNGQYSSSPVYSLSELHFPRHGSLQYSAQKHYVCP
jgi:hypothetical protein